MSGARETAHHAAREELREFEAPGPSGPRLMVRFLRDYVPSQFFWLLCACVFMLAGAGLTTATAWLMKPAFNGIFEDGDVRTLMLIGLAFPALFLARGVAGYFARLFLNMVGLNVVAATRKRLYDHIQGMDVSFFGRYRVGSLINRVVGDTTALRSLIVTLMKVVSEHVPLIAGLIVSLFVLDWELALFALVVIPLALPGLMLLNRLARRVARKTVVETGVFGGHLLQTFQNMRLVKVYGAEAFERARVFALSDRLYRLGQQSQLIGGALNAGMELIVGIAFSLIAVYAAYRLGQGTLTPGDLAAFVTACYLTYRPLKQAGRLTVAAQQLQVVLRRFYSLLDRQADVRQPADARPLTVTDGEIHLRDIRFTYPGADAPALTDVTLTVPAGKTTALVGRSGAGKSSVLSLIVRFYDPTSGTLTIDGQDIARVTFRSLWQAVTVVTQDTVVIDDTIRANIAFGRPEASPIDIEDAAKKAALHDFVMTLPQGYDTPVGENGTHLSGGQRQRLAIARAMLKDAPILLLDEATSALDPENEQAVRRAFEAARTGRTCLVIAHRLSTIRNADVIHVLDGGRLVASGTHESLLRVSPAYAALCANEFTDDRPS